MYWLLWSYAVIFAALLLFNAYFWLSHKGKWNILFYELLSGTYLVFMVILFIYPEWQRQVTFWFIMAVPVVLGIECYLSIFGNLEEQLEVVPGPEVSTTELETARGFSVLFSAPAYIIAAKIFIDRFF